MYLVEISEFVQQELEIGGGLQTCYPLFLRVPLNILPACQVLGVEATESTEIGEEAGERAGVPLHLVTEPSHCLKDSSITDNWNQSLRLHF